MRDFMRKARPWAVVLFVSAFLVACDDGDDPADLDFDAETAGEFAEAAESVMEPLAGSSDASITIGNAMFTLTGFGVELAAALPFQVATRMTAESLMRRDRPAGLASASAGPQGPVIPDSLEGTTFVWDFEVMGYVPSDEPGAPSNGIRFIYYAIDPSGFEPAQPLNPLGYLDLVDASTTSNARLELDLVQDDGDVKLADYFVQAGVTNNLETTTATMTSQGFVRGEDERADFDMSFVFAGNETAGTFSEDADIVFANEAENTALRLDFEYDDDGEQVIEQGAFTVERGSDEAVFQYEASGETELDTLDGELLFNGDEVVVFSAVGDGEIEFTRPDGGALTSAEIDALTRMWFGYFFTVIFAYSILLPFLALVAPGL
jgi:hypothetical protein